VSGSLLLLLVTTFAMTTAGGFIPIFNTELYLLAVTATAPPGVRLPVALAAALGQITGKAIMYGAGRGLVALPLGRHAERVARVRARLEGARWPKLFLFWSAVTGFPPFFIVSVLCGTIRFPFAVFLAIGLVGRSIRFSIVVFFPHLIMGLLG
jgi:membrane protein YqaA with SNARE-associated domain